MTTFHIYTLTHVPTGRVYVGRTTTRRLESKDAHDYGVVPIRFAEHLSAMHRGDHFNLGLSLAWTGDHTAWTFQVVETMPNVDVRTANEVERAWMARYPHVFNEVGRVYKRRIPRVSAEVKAEILRRVQAGDQPRVIAAELQVSTATVSLVRKAAGMPCRVRRRTSAPLHRTQALWRRFSEIVRDPVLRPDGRVHVTKTLARHGLPVDLNTRFYHWRNLGQPAGLPCAAAYIEGQLVTTTGATQ